MVNYFVNCPKCSFNSCCFHTNRSVAARNLWFHHNGHMFSVSMSEVSTSTFLDHLLVLAITSGLLFNKIKVLCICTHVV